MLGCTAAYAVYVFRSGGANRPLPSGQRDFHKRNPTAATILLSNAAAFCKALRLFMHRQPLPPKVQHAMIRRCFRHSSRADGGAGCAKLQCQQCRSRESTLRRVTAGKVLLMSESAMIRAPVSLVVVMWIGMPATFDPRMHVHCTCN